MSALRFDEIVEEIFHVRLGHGWCYRRRHYADFLHRHTQFLRHVWHRQTAPALRQIKAPNSKHQAPDKRQAPTFKDNEPNASNPLRPPHRLRSRKYLSNLGELAVLVLDPTATSRH
jgi:hypothetical protein